MLNEKGNGLIIGLLVGLLIAGGLLGVYHYTLKTPSTLPTSQVYSEVIPTPSIIPSPSDGAPLNINGFPVYPEAQFFKTQDWPPCTKGEYSGFSLCNATTYAWKVEANFNQVNSFYNKDKSGSGWKCSGGAGIIENESNANVQTDCKKDNFNFGLAIKTRDGSSEIILIIPKGSPTGE